MSIVKNDLTESQIARATDLAEKYKSIVADIKVYETYKDIIKTELMDLLEMTGERKINGVKLVEKHHVNKTSIRNLKHLFNEEFDIEITTKDDNKKTIIDSVMVEVDIDLTVDNMRYLNGLSEPLTKSIGERLERLQKSKYYDLEIGK